jgi:hypothetical protein
MDLDWASEDSIKETLAIVQDYSWPFTVFVTHHSETFWRYKENHPELNFGLHPNFLPGSSHGTYLGIFPKA